jgi:hypothetical protein
MRPDQEIGMSKDYSAGRYLVFKGRMPGQQPIGRIDHDEFVRNNTGQLLYRVDGNEVYDMKGGLVGEITPSGENAMVVTRGPSGIDCHMVFTPE